MVRPVTYAVTNMEDQNAVGVHVRQADTAVFIKPYMVLNKIEVHAAIVGLSRTFEDVLRVRDRAKQ